MPPQIWTGYFAAAALGLLLVTQPVVGRNLGQWEAADPALRAWYEGLMQPDVPRASCCGEADAYFADEVHVRDGKTFVVITDTRPDAPRSGDVPSPDVARP